VPSWPRAAEVCMDGRGGAAMSWPLGGRRAASLALARGRKPGVRSCHVVTADRDNIDDHQSKSFGVAATPAHREGCSAAKPEAARSCSGSLTTTGGTRRRGRLRGQDRPAGSRVGSLVDRAVLARLVRVPRGETRTGFSFWFTPSVEPGARGRARWSPPFRRLDAGHRQPGP